MTDILHDHVHVNRSDSQCTEDSRGHPRSIGHSYQSHLGLILVQRYAAYNDVLHAVSFFFHNRSRIII